MTTSPWNKGRIIGQKRPLQISHIWGIRIRLELEGKVRDLALFNMALDSKLRGCDLVKLKVSDVAYGHSVSGRATVLQQKTGSPVQFELTKGTREAVAAWIKWLIYVVSTICFSPASVLHDIFQPGNITVFFMDGLISWVWTRLCTVRILCEEPSHI